MVRGSDVVALSGIARRSGSSSVRPLTRPAIVRQKFVIHAAAKRNFPAWMDRGTKAGNNKSGSLIVT